MGFSMIKCPICGKEFRVYDATVWAYKVNKRCVCSWSCARKYEKDGKNERD